MPQKREELKKMKTSYKTNKNDYILFSGDLNIRIGNSEIHNTVGNFGEPVTNTSGMKLRDFATYKT
jgi:hypothetical protein